MSDLHARYDNGWYCCWLIERRDGPQPTWLGEWSWETDASKAIWYARKSDADAACNHQLKGVPKIVVCEHGFQIDEPDLSLRAERDRLSTEVLEQARLLGMSGSREAALLAERDRLATMLARYGAHDPDCNKNYKDRGEELWDDKRPCTCGFDAALKSEAM